ncbi:MAG: hypothetical protein ICV83_12325 [Cytophagales bacterium]|nr:hypothetical protein [Cytophagales bacterium]
MKRIFPIPFLLSLTLLLPFVSCNRNSPEIALQNPKATLDIEDLAAKWTTRMESPEALKAVVEAYKALTPAQMEQFIRADARHRVAVLGEDQEAADQYVETFLAMNKAAEATFKVGYNKVTPDQFAQLEKKPELQGSLHRLVEAFNKADLKHQPLDAKAAAGRRPRATRPGAACTTVALPGTATTSTAAPRSVTTTARPSNSAPSTGALPTRSARVTATGTSTS